MPPKPEPSKLALAFTVGSLITSNIVGGILLGYFLDRWLKTAPWLSVSGLILGTIGAFAGLIHTMSKLNRDE
ncbi:MAG TPA: AtpZ/AtpI family protein [Blastocatellia bacterium]|nr:AtpZ/AtpI family protein [Blastocatellia bacterium]